MISPNIRTAYLTAWFILAAFALALLGPAVKVDFGAWNNPDAQHFPGWIITALAWPYYLSNLAVALSPLLFLFAARRKQARLYLGILPAIYIATPFTLFLPSMRDSILEVGWGFYLWCAAHLIAAVAAGIGLKTCKP